MSECYTHLYAASCAIPLHLSRAALIYCILLRYADNLINLEQTAVPNPQCYQRGFVYRGAIEV